LDERDDERGMVQEENDEEIDLGSEDATAGPPPATEDFLRGIDVGDETVSPLRRRSRPLTE
jgi:hypothetical protein